METGPQPGTIAEGEVQDLAYGGSGVLRMDRWVVMIRGAYPGDRVSFRVRRRRKGLIEADLVAVLRPSPDRVAPACPHVEVCGGCPLQGLAPEAQTLFKDRQARETLRRIGGFEPDEVAAPWRTASPWFYRNKMEFTFGRRPWIAPRDWDPEAPLPSGPALGLHPRGRFEAIFDVTDCRLQSPLSNRIVSRVRASAARRGLEVYDSRRDSGLLRHLVVRQAATSPDVLAVFVARREDPGLDALAEELCAGCPEISGVVASINLRRAAVAQGDYEITLRGRAHWEETIAGLHFRVGASSFFQTQTAGGEALVREVLAGGAPRATERVLDLCCGVGTFTLAAAREAACALGVEAHAPAVAEAAANATRNGIRNAGFIVANVEAKERQPWEEEAWDLVIVDPPRAGLHPRALARLRGLRAPRIVYVSCNPATLARDAGPLVVEDGYRPRRLRVFDLFPHTPHLESVLLLERA